MQNKNNYVPDVLDCLANLSNDEVFTPPVVVNQMLDMLPKDLFKSKETTFLDPFTKTGVFLREITKRLLTEQISDYIQISDEIEEITKTAIQLAIKNKSLDVDSDDYEKNACKIGDNALKSHKDANKYLNFELNLQDALDHILKNQVFGIAITELTAQLARRSLYCSKDASGRYSVAGTIFGDNSAGNIRFESMKHTWDKTNLNGTVKTGASCICCGASSSNLERPDSFESHAYEFIHKDADDIRKEFDNMEFTVICGNPPYQLSDGGAQASATPIYNKFIEQAKRLNPKYLTMIVPSRWMTGGKGLDKFRDVMINDDSIKELHDFVDSKMCFSGVDIKGGVCYFLRDNTYHGNCHCVRHDVNGSEESIRPLCENGDNIFIREPKLISIKNKVNLTVGVVENISSPQKPYGLRGDVFKDESKYGLGKMSDTPIENGYSIIGLGEGQKRIYKYVDKNYKFPKCDNLEKYKLFVTRNYGCGELGEIAATPILAKPGMACTETFIEIGPFDTEDELNNFYSYFKTKFFRAMVGIRKQDQGAARGIYHYVPIQDFSKLWTDEELYKKYKLTQDEINFIETNIKAMV